MRSHLSIAIAAFALAGCAGMVRTVAYHYPLPAATARVHLHDAGAAGPVLLEVRGNPFAEDVARPFAAAASHTVIGLGTTFTADRAAAAKPAYRLVVQFHPADRATIGDVCDPARPVAQSRQADRLTALVVFCHGTQPLLSVSQVAPAADRPDAPVIRSLAQQAVLQMFPPERLSEPDDYWPD
jgi:hypothetical protein